MDYSGNWNTKHRIDLVENSLWNGLWTDLSCHTKGKTEGKWGWRRRRKQPLGNIFWQEIYLEIKNTKRQVDIW